jgi:hypothetical protein
MDLSYIKETDWENIVKRALSAGFTSRISVMPGVLIWAINGPYRVRFLIMSYKVNIQAQKSMSAINCFNHADEEFPLKAVPDVFSLRCKRTTKKEERKIFTELYDRLIKFFISSFERDEMVTGPQNYED